MSAAILAGKAILVTGASRGIGAATARAAHREGAAVIAHYGANSVELAYMRSHVSPRTPRGIADTVDELHRAATDLLDADVRRQPGDAASQAFAKLQATYNAVTAACDAEGASK